MAVPLSRMCTMQELCRPEMQRTLDEILGPRPRRRLDLWVPPNGTGTERLRAVVAATRRAALGGRARNGVSRHTPHRKLWEYGVIVNTLADEGLLRRGVRGVGFAVGTEQLPAVFASRHCDVVASDRPEDEGDDVNWEWRESGQHAASIDALHHPHICDSATLHEHVTFRPVDMRSIPSDLTGFDFCWSSCALEHLGDLDAGMTFVREAMRCLEPGGLALHTTEFNVASNDSTVAVGGSVVYRRRDLEGLAEDLVRDGHSIEFDWTPGRQFEDRFVDREPYAQRVHLLLELGGHVATSFLLAIRKAPA